MYNPAKITKWESNYAYLHLMRYKRYDVKQILMPHCSYSYKRICPCTVCDISLLVVYDCQFSALYYTIQATNLVLDNH